MTTRYIAPTTASPPGNNGNPGTLAAPWASIAQFMASAADGDRLECRGGTYGQSGNQGVTVNKSVTIAAYAGEVPTFNVSRNTKCISITANAVTIDGLTIVGAGADVNMVSGTTSDESYGIFAGQALDQLTIRNNHVSDLWAGIWVFSYSGWFTNLLIDNNVVERLVYAAIMVGGDNGGVIRENTTSRVGMVGYDVTNGNSYGIAVTSGAATYRSKNTLIEDNVVEYVPLWEGLDTHGGIDLTFRHNIVRYCARGFICMDTSFGDVATRIIVEYNLFTFPLNDPARMPPGTDRNAAMREYLSVDCIFRFNHVGNSAAETGIAYPTIFYDTGGGSTGTDEHDNTRSETLPDVPGGGGTDIAYDALVVADGASFFAAMGEASGHLVDTVGALASVTEAGMTYQQPGPLAGGASNYGVAYSGGRTEWNDANALDLGDVFSIELWLKRSTFGALQAVLDKTSTGGLGYSVYFTAGNYIRLASGNGNTEIVTSTSTISNTSWHHVVFTKSGATAKIYIDTVEGHTDGTPSTVLTNTTSALAVGSWGDASNPFPGTLSRVATYKLALAAATVSAHYAARSVVSAVSVVPNPAGLVLTGATPLVAHVAVPVAVPDAAALVLTGATPTVTRTGAASVLPTPGVLALTPGFPSVSVSGGSLTLLIAGVDRIGKLKAGTLHCTTGPDGAQGVADFTLIDFTPADNDTVLVKQGVTVYYSGFIRSRNIVTQGKAGRWFCRVGCQNDEPFVVALGNAPFGLSDTPNGTTTFGFERSDLQVTSARGTSYVDTTTSAVVGTRRAGVLPGHTVTVTSADQGLAAVPMYCQKVDVSWPTNTPLYTLSLGDPVLGLGEQIQYNIGHPSIESAASLATALHTPKVFDALPPLPDPVYPVGTIGYLTTDGKLYRVTPDGLLWTNVLDGADVLVASITAGAISAGAIGAEALAAQLVLASKIVTPALTGARLELDQSGLRAYDTAEVPNVNIPTDGSAVQVTGEIVASSLVSTSASEFRGTNLLANASVTRLGAGIDTPTAMPTLIESAATVPMTIGAYSGPAHGLAYDPTSNTYWYARNYAGIVGTELIEYDQAGNILRHTLSRSGVHLAPTQARGVAVNATHVFVLYNDGQLYKHLRTTLALEASANLSTSLGNAGRANAFYDITAGRVVLVTTTNSAVLRFRLVNPSTLTVASTLDTTGYVSYDGYLTGGVLQGGFYWIAGHTPTSAIDVRCFNATTGAYVANRDFGIVASTYRVSNGLAYDTTNARFVGSDSVNLTQFTSWDWTTESAKYWAGYSWYDSVTTTHETPVGPRASSTLHRRVRLGVTNAAMPTGGAEPVDSVRVYMERSATAPAAGTFKLQSTDALTTRYLTTFATGGAADPTSNDFPASNPAELKSAATGWSLLGDGTATMPSNKYTESTGFTITGGGSATFGSKVARWSQLGNLVAWRLSFSVTAGGSGASAVAITNPGWPIPPGNITISGDRGGVGVTPIGVRITTPSGDISAIKTLLDAATVTGADLANGATYSFNGSYYAD